MFKAIFAALAFCLAATPVLAQTKTDVTVIRDAELALQSFARQTQAFDAVYLKAVAIGVEIMDRADEARKFAEVGASQAEVAVWAESWIPLTRQKLADLSRELENLPAPELRKPMTMVTDFPQMAKTTVDGIASFFEKVAQVAPSAANRDASALKKLSTTKVDGAIIMMGIENAMLEHSIAGMDEGDSQFWLMRSTLSTNRASVALLEAHSAMSEGDKVDSKKASNQIQALAEEGKNSAGHVRPVVASLLRSMRDNPSFRGSSLLLRTEEMAVLLEESADVEIEISNTFLAVASDVAKGGIETPEIKSHMDNYYTLIGRRVKLVDQLRGVSGR